MATTRQKSFKNSPLEPRRTRRDPRRPCEQGLLGSDGPYPNPLPEKAARSRSWIGWLWAFVGAAVVALLFYFCFRGIDVRGLLERSREIQLPPVFAAMALAAAVLVLSALEWKVFLPRGSAVSTGRLLKLIAVMVMLQNTLHHFAGHAFAVIQLGHREKLSKTTALSILTQDQLAEGFARLIVFGSLAWLAAVPAWAQAGVQGVAITVVAAYLVALVFAWRHRNFNDDEPRGSGHCSLLRHRLAQWAHQLGGLRDARIALAAVLLAVAKKLLKAAAVACVQRSLAVDLPFYAPLLVVAAIDLATMISIAPGHLGVFEATVFFTYRYLAVDADRALLLALLYHAVFLSAMVVPGLLVTLAGALNRSSSSRRRPEPLLADGN